MAYANGLIPNLINGISQQAPALRLPSQAEAQDNFYSSVTDGLVKRPRTDWVAKILDQFTPGTFSHMIHRDEQENYVVVILANGTIRVFDFAGNEKTVTNLAAGYAASLNPEEDLRALTIADFTFIVNRKVTVQPGTATSPTRPYEALYYVISGNYSKTYRINRDGAQVATFTTPDSSDVSHEGYVDTTYIADQLYNGLAVGASQAKGRYHSTVYFRDTDTDFTTDMLDGYGGRASKAIKGVTQKFSDLPLDGPDGFVTEIAGSDTTGFDNYWVSLTQGVWKETLKPGTRLGLNPATMPHALVRNPDGSFTFKPLDWTDRKCGSLDTVPDPSFVGNTIQDVFFHRNRLGFLTEENVVMSEAGQFYNFYRASLTATLDTDPIDVAASHVKVSLLKHAVPYNDLLIAFSEQTQFKISGNDLFTPKTVSARPLTELEASPTIRPVASKTDLYFVTEQDGFAQVQEYFLSNDQSAADVDTITNNVPSYIPAGVHRLASSPELDLLVCATHAAPQTLYVYKYFYQGNEKLQASWSTWTFPEVDRIVNFQFRKSGLDILFIRNGAVHLERLKCETRQMDSPLPYLVHLDQHIVLRPGLTNAATYDSVTDTTTVTLPYPRPTSLVCVAAPGGVLPAGTEVEATAGLAANTIVLDGDQRGQPFHAGIEYTSRYDFSRFFFRAQNSQANGRTIVNENGRLQIINFNLVFARTANFRVEVSLDGRNARQYPLNGRRVSEASNLLNEIVLSDGHLNIPIYSRNDRVKVSIVSDTWQPCAFEGAEWTGSFHPKTREL